MSLRARKKQRTADDLYDAALTLFTARGYDEVTVEEICELAEVSRATFFRYYGAKAGLIAEFNRRLAERVAARLRAMAEDATATEQLFAMQDELAQAWTSSGPAVRAMALDFKSVAIDATEAKLSPFPELLKLCTGIVAGGQASGEFDTRPAPGLVALTIAGLLGGITMYWIAAGRGRLDRAMRDALDLLITGLAAPPKNRRKP